MNYKRICLTSKLQLISNVLRTKRYATIAMLSGIGLGIIYYFLTLSMLASHLNITMEIMPLYILTSIALTIGISALAGINFAMMAFKIKRMRMMNSVKSNSSAILGGAFAAFTPGMSGMYCTSCSNFRRSWRIVTVSYAGIRIKIYFSRGFGFLYLVDY